MTDEIKVLISFLIAIFIVLLSLTLSAMGVAGAVLLGIEDTKKRDGQTYSKKRWNMGVAFLSVVGAFIAFFILGTMFITYKVGMSIVDK
jgi:hypothetical protein